MPTIFSRIIAGEVPSYKVYEDEFCFAFLDIKPHALGHTLVVPKVEVDHYMDLDDNYTIAMSKAVKLISSAIKEATQCNRVAVVILGFDVPHVHIHLIPAESSDIIIPEKAHTEEDDAMIKIVELIKNAI